MYWPMNAQVAIVATPAMQGMIELYAIRKPGSLLTRSLESTTASESLLFGRSRLMTVGCGTVAHNRLPLRFSEFFAGSHYALNKVFHCGQVPDFAGRFDAEGQCLDIVGLAKKARINDGPITRVR